jgi:hypothetical protein
MTMSKKHFIDLAKMVILAKGTKDEFTPYQLELLAQFCTHFNNKFDSHRWYSYIEKQK